MRPFEFIALTPSGSAEPALAIAAQRAGGIGILNLDYTTLDKAEKAIAKLARYTQDNVGVRFSLQDAEFVTAVIDQLPPCVSIVVLAQIDQTTAPSIIASLQATGRQLWIEVTDLASGISAEQWGADALIAKGHEAGGWVGQETTFILLQHLRQQLNLPIYAQGGIGLHTVAAVYAGGAAGVVLDHQLALVRESRLPAHVQQLIERMDGSETVNLGAEIGMICRMFQRPKATPVAELSQLVVTLDPTQRSVWREAVAQRVGWGDFTENLWLLGQDVAFAKPFADRFRNVSGVFQALRASLESHIDSAVSLKSFSENSPLAQSHRTRYPIVQGPMTRVSDTAPFALSIAEGGGLPFLALALMRKDELEPLLQETKAKAGDLSWGVGLLGFVSLELRREQLALVQQYKPPFAIIAGGRPDQAAQLEKEGIATYIHVPSPNLLKMFIQDGARRFIFEGKECGGHIGPRSSFVLWESMIEMLLANLPTDASNLHILFAGGVHDAVSSAMVAALAAPLAEKGIKIGVLMGTGYLFTREAVESGAILPNFQQEAIHCQQTVTVESGAGHAIRCVENPFTNEFDEMKRELFREGLSADAVREKLDALNIGRLRIASKGITRHPEYRVRPDAPKFMMMSEEDQHAQGMFMIGQLAALRDQITTVEALHHSVSADSAVLLDQLVVAETIQPVPANPANIAIIGLELIAPKAGDRQQYWENIFNSVYALTEVPRERWDTDLYFDPDKTARDKIYSKWGGFLDEIVFDPIEFGMPPMSLKSIDPMQLLGLKVAKAALEDAGYAGKSADLSRTGVVLGMSGGLGDVGTYYSTRSLLPTIVGKEAAAIINATNGFLPEWTEDSFAGLLPNVTAGRIANRLDCGGVNYIVDAACGSSLAAIHLAVKELVSGNTDMMIVGGVDTIQSPFGFMCFAKTQALTPDGRPKTFSADGDGIAISEAVVMLVLKRLPDAERDGDRIYAVIQGASGSSDGRALSMTAPRAEGQISALNRVYTQSGIDPKTVALFEAHGTGTALGDRTEASSLGRFLEQHNASPNTHAIGSVKSMIGHTKGAAGVAGLAKAALALYHKVLPPTIGVDRPNPKANFNTGPLYVNSQTRPWIHSQSHPRRAGVSAFGFGGTNFHVVMEEYTNNFLEDDPAPLQIFPSELFLWAGGSRTAIDAAVLSLLNALDAGAAPTLRDLSYTLWELYRSAENPTARLAIVATSIEELHAKLNQFRDSATGHFPVSTAIFYSETVITGKVAFLFPGQGSQYVDMLRDVTILFPEMRTAFESADQHLVANYPRPLSTFVFPPPAFDEETRKAQLDALTQTNIAQPALGAADLGMFHLLQAFNITPDMTAGHSYGEYVALYAAGVYDEKALFTVSEARGRAIIDTLNKDSGTMSAVAADEMTIRPIIEPLAEVWIANLNAPDQTIIAGSERGVAEANARLQAAGLHVRPVKVSAAFHTPMLTEAQQLFSVTLGKVDYKVSRIEVYANLTAHPHGDSAESIRETLTKHITQPVRFVDEINAMYEAGARLFIECGPRNILSGLTRKILGHRPHLALATDHPKVHGLHQLQELLGQLAINGAAVDLTRLFAGRTVRKYNLRRLVQETQPEPIKPTAWLVGGGAARPHQEAAKIGKPADLSQLYGQKIAPAPQIVSVPPASAPAQTALAPAQKAQSAPLPATQSLPPLPPMPSLVDSYQAMMSHFLQTQQEVMMAALRGQSTAAPTPQPQLPPAPPVRPTPPPPTPITRVEEKIATPESIPAPAEPQAIHPVPRSVLVAVSAPLEPGEAQFSAESTLLITQDNHLAPELAARINAHGGKAVVIRTDEDVTPYRPIGGILHLAPLADQTPFLEIDREEWQMQQKRNIKRLFQLAQQIDRTVPQPILFAAVKTTHQPTHGGVIGFLKTAKLEWENVRVQSADFDHIPTLDQLWAELTARNPLVVARYVNGQRQTVVQKSQPLAKKATSLAITKEDVILVTGGARGITADVAITLAQASQATLILVGRTPLPPSVESAETAHLEKKELKNRLIQLVTNKGEKPNLREIEKQYHRILAEREMRATLATIEAVGSKVSYLSADVRDPIALQTIFARYPITGIIHGAGVIEDKLIDDKSADSFNRVFDTKVDSLYGLIHSADPKHLKFIALFSSAAAAFGNRGQSDYAAANSLMNQVAIYLNAEWRPLVVALGWGPWGKKGMVSAELQRQFAQQGIELIDVPAGCQAVLDELRYGSGGAMIYAGGTWGAPSQPTPPASTALPQPLLNTATFDKQDNKLILTRTLDPAYDRYLDHHRLDGKPVLPMAVSAELMAEAAAAGWPDLQLIGMRDMQVLKGIVFENDAPVAIQITAKAQGDPPYDRVGANIDVHITSADNPRILYRAVVELGDRLPEPPLYDQLPAYTNPFPMSVAEGYEKWLFHGPIFQAIVEIEGSTENGFVADIVASPASIAFAEPVEGTWQFDPIVVDSGLQGGLLWARQTLDATPIPLGFQTARRYATLSPQRVKCHIYADHNEAGRTLSVNMAFIDAEDRLLLHIEGVNCPYNAALNRLGGHEKYAPLVAIV